MTQTHLPTISAISTLRDEALAAGDTAMAQIATAALDGYTDAIVECRRVIDDARARGGGAAGRTPSPAPSSTSTPRRPVWATPTSLAMRGAR